MKLLNPFGERIDVLVEGNSRSAKTAVFVHGFGTDKNGGENIFIDISNSLQEDFRIVRFDFTGCGGSEGSQEDVNFEKQGEVCKYEKWINQMIYKLYGFTKKEIKIIENNVY